MEMKLLKSSKTTVDTTTSYHKFRNLGIIGLGNGHHGNTSAGDDVKNYGNGSTLQQQHPQ